MVQSQYHWERNCRIISYIETRIYMIMYILQVTYIFCTASKEGKGVCNFGQLCFSGLKERLVIQFLLASKKIFLFLLIFLSFLRKKLCFHQGLRSTDSNAQGVRLKTLLFVNTAFYRRYSHCPQGTKGDQEIN